MLVANTANVAAALLVMPNPAARYPPREALEDAPTCHIPLFADKAKLEPDSNGEEGSFLNAGVWYPSLHLMKPLRSSDNIRWPQETIISAFVRMYPDRFFSGFNFPFIEDIINRPPFTTYLDMERKARRSHRGSTAASHGKQARSKSGKRR